MVFHILWCHPEREARGVGHSRLKDLVPLPSGFFSYQILDQNDKHLRDDAAAENKITL